MLRCIYVSLFVFQSDIVSLKLRNEVLEQQSEKNACVLNVLVSVALIILLGT